MVTIIYGTETGNAELVASDIADELSKHGVDTDCVDMEDVSLDALVHTDTLVVVCSTYGDGELPASSQAFYQRLQAERPDLAHLTFSAFGLGDSYYETFNQGICFFEQLLSELGAQHVGERGTHDASSGAIPTDKAIEWVSSVLLPWLHARTAA